MKVMQVNKFWRVRGGSERYVFELSRMLTERGHEIIPFAMQDPDNEPSRYQSLFVSPVELSDPYRISMWKRMTIAARILYSKESERRISTVADLSHPDIAHMHNIYHHLSPSILRPLVDRGIGIVMTIHDYKLVCPALRSYNKGQICERCRPYRYLSCVKGKCVKGSRGASLLCATEMFYHDLVHAYTSSIDRFIAPSQFMAGKLVMRGLDPEKIVVIPNFVDLGRWQPEGEGGNYVLFLGRLTQEKGIVTLIKAVAGLPDVPLKIVGSGMADSPTRMLARELGADNIEFLGFKSEDEVRRLVRGSRFTCVPSEWYENAPMSVLEAFACGKPVIGSRIGGLPEMIRDGETGLLAEPGDEVSLRSAVQRLWEDPDLAVTMGKNARRLIETDYSPETHYDKIIKTYQQVKRT